MKLTVPDTEKMSTAPSLVHWFPRPAGTGEGAGEGDIYMSPLHHHPSRCPDVARLRPHAARGRRLTKAAITVGASFVLALTMHPQSASASPVMTTTTTVNVTALGSSQNAPHTEGIGDHEARFIATPSASTSSAGIPPHTPVTAVPTSDSTWGIPTPILAAALGAAAGTGTTALFFQRGRRHTLIDRAEDQQRQDASAAQLRADQKEEQRRIDARDSWKRLYDDLGKNLSDALTVYIDARDHLLCHDDDEAQLISALLRRLSHALERALGNRSEELTGSLTTLRGCLHDLQAALLPERTSLADPSTLSHAALMDLLARSAKQTLITTELGRLVHDAEVALNTEWGRLATTGR